MGLLAAGALALPGIINMFGNRGGGGGIDWKKIYSYFASQRPTGYFMPEDQSFIDRQTGGARRSLAAHAGDLRSAAAGRLLQRGIRGPAAERTLGKISQQELVGSEQIGEAGLDTAYKIRSGREQNQWGLLSQGMGNAFQAEATNLRRKDAKNKAFWDSFSALAPQIMGLFGGGTSLTGGNDGDPTTAQD